MRVLNSSKNLSLAGSSVALGDFDALHKGHMEVIKSAGEYAREHNLLWTVYMFSSRPNKNAENINSLFKRIEILEKIGVDTVVLEEFTDSYKNTSCEEFVSEYLVDRLSAKAVFAGFNYKFGKDASGDAIYLKELCEKAGISGFIKECVKAEGIPVSSTGIRNLIKNGEVLLANELMGRYFSISGEVVEGKKIGRTIGFPTANINYPKGIIIPLKGVYISRCKIGDNKYYSITNVGEKPTVFDKSNNIETAIAGFSNSIYGEEIEIEFCKRIRDIKKFSDLEELKKQLEKDMNKAKVFFDEDIS